jgi:hypothetical protein
MSVPCSVVTILMHQGWIIILAKSALVAWGTA